MTGIAPLHPKDNLYIAVCRLRESGQWGLPVVEAGRQVGTLTARAILDRLEMNEGQLAVPCVAVEDVMERIVARSAALGKANA